MDARELEHRFTPQKVRSRPTDKATIIKLVVQRIIGSFFVVAIFGVLVFIVNEITIDVQQEQFIQEHSFADGTVDIKAVRAWMTLRFVSASYGVPEAFLYAQLGIPPDEANAEQTLGKLNSRYSIGASTHGDYPAAVDKIQAAILAYRANPTPPGLAQIQGWMNIRYIANSTGVPESYLLVQTGILTPHAATTSLTDLGLNTGYPGGVFGLIEALQKALADYASSNTVIVTQ